MKNKLTILLLIIFAIFYHLYKLEEIPKEPYSFDAVDDIYQAEAIYNGQRPIFFPRRAMEPFFFYLVAFLAKIPNSGVNFLTIKLTASVIGFISTIIFYFIIKKIFKDQFLSLITSVFFTSSSWLLINERIGYRGVVLIPIITLILSLFIDLKKKCLKEYLVIGMLLAIGFYTNSIFWVVIAISIILILFYFLKEGNKKYLFGLVISLFTFFILCLPLIIYANNNRQIFFRRIIQRRDEQKEMGLDTVKYLIGLTDNYLMNVEFFLKDGVGQSFPHYANVYPGASLLDKISLFFFIIGFFDSFYRIFRKKDLRFLAVLVFFLSAPLPSSSISVGFKGELPDIFRLCIGLPSVYFLIGLGILKFQKIIFFLLKITKIDKKISPSLFSYFILTIMTFYSFSINYKRIFIDYPEKMYQWQNYPFYEKITKEIFNDPKIFPNNIYLINFPYPFDNIVFNYYLNNYYLNKRSWNNILPNDALINESFFLTRGKEIKIISPPNFNLIDEFFRNRCRKFTIYNNNNNNRYKIPVYEKYLCQI